MKDINVILNGVFNHAPRNSLESSINSGVGYFIKHSHHFLIYHSWEQFLTEPSIKTKALKDWSNDAYYSSPVFKQHLNDVANDYLFFTFDTYRCVEHGSTLSLMNAGKQTVPFNDIVPTDVQKETSVLDVLIKYVHLKPYTFTNGDDVVNQYHIMARKDLVTVNPKLPMPVYYLAEQRYGDDKGVIQYLLIVHKDDFKLLKQGEYHDIVYFTA